jgi:hypothetical protein
MSLRFHGKFPDQKRFVPTIEKSWSKKFGSVHHLLIHPRTHPLRVFDRCCPVIHGLFVSPSEYSLKQNKTNKVNVAGESKNLEPTGEDVLGINIPFGEFLNAGSFDTTFLDDSMRVSRSKTGPVDQLRVFIKTETKNNKSISSDDEIEIDDDEIVDDDELAIDAEVVDDEKESTPSDDDDDDEIIAEAPSDIEIPSDDTPSNDDNEIIAEAPSDIEN